VEDESAQNNWGFIHSDFMNDESYELTKQYYAMANFSKFIRPGSSIIIPDNARSVAAYNEDEKQLTLVITNDANDEKALEFDISDFNLNTGSADVYTTSKEKNLESSELKVYTNGFKIDLDKKSITTIVIDDVEK